MTKARAGGSLTLGALVAALGCARPGAAPGTNRLVDRYRPEHVADRWSSPAPVDDYGTGPEPMRDYRPEPEPTAQYRPEPVPDPYGGTSAMEIDAEPEPEPAPPPIRTSTRRAPRRRSDPQPNS